MLERAEDKGKVGVPSDSTALAVIPTPSILFYLQEVGLESGRKRGGYLLSPLPQKLYSFLEKAE